MSHRARLVIQHIRHMEYVSAWQPLSLKIRPFYHVCRASVDGEWVAMPVKSVFMRLPMPVKVGDIVHLSNGRALVQTAKVADDLRDAKCVVLLNREAAK